MIYDLITAFVVAFAAVTASELLTEDLGDVVGPSSTDPISPCAPSAGEVSIILMVVILMVANTLNDLHGSSSHVVQSTAGVDWFRYHRLRW